LLVDGSVTSAVAVELGADPGDSAELVDMVAGVGNAPGTVASAGAADGVQQSGVWQGADFDGLAPLFSRFELQKLLETERGTALLAMRNEEQLQRTVQ
jgi:hypothetical protein